MTNFPAGHEVTDADFATLIPLKGLRILNAGNPIATTSGTTELDLAKYQLSSVTLVTGRYYIARYQVTFTKSVATDSFDLKVRANTATSGTVLGLQAVFQADPNQGTKEFAFLFAGDSSYTSLYLSAVRTGGTGSLSYYGTNGGYVRGFAQLEDKGDTDNWSDVA